MFRRVKEEPQGLPDLPPQIPQPPQQPIPPYPKQKAKEEWRVVEKLPVQEVRKATLPDGTVVNFVTIEEYLTNQANGGE